VNAYRLFLGRSPENEQAIERHIGPHSTIWSLIRDIQNSPEAKRYRVWVASGDVSRYKSKVDISVTPQEFARMMSHVEKVWTDYGKNDPYYSVLSNPKYHSEGMNHAQREEFYATGKRDIEFLHLLFERNGIPFPKRPSICELGCGLGRVSEHLAKLASRFTGIDISATHLEHARSRVSADNASFVHLGDYLKSTETFDLFFSVITLQHNPPPVMAHLLDAFLGRINPGGFACFQIPCHIYDYNFTAKSYLAGKHKADFMEMHALPQRHVFPILEKHGLKPVEVFVDAHIGPAGHSYEFFARKA